MINTESLARVHTHTHTHTHTPILLNNNNKIEIYNNIAIVYCA